MSPPPADHAVATPQRDATAAAERAFAAGGNAIDAALAAAAALTVAYPHMCAVGGDLFALVHAPDGTVVNVNASGPAARAADADALRARGPRMPLHGPETVTVPGLVAGWERVHALGARRSWADALAPAIALAEDGVEVVPGLAGAIAASEAVGSDPGMAAVFAPGGRRLRAGERLRQPALAATLRTLAAGGARELYAGELSARLLAGLTTRGVALTAEDLRGYEPELGPPLAGRFRELEVLTSPPNSSGVLVPQALAALEATGVADPLGDDAAVLAEILRAGSEQRDRMLGDPRAVPVDLDAFLGEERVAELAARALAGAAGERDAVAVQSEERPQGDTIAVVAADRDGRAVSLIQSLFRSFGAGILEPATGVLVHNRGAFFSLAPGHPGELAPGRRPPHTLLPLLVRRDGRPRCVLGSMGGKVHAQIHVQVLLRVLAGEAPQAAVDAPRWIAGGLEPGEPDDVIRVEDGCPPAARAALERARLRIVDMPRWSEQMGHAQAIRLDPGPVAGSDRRADP